MTDTAARNLDERPYTADEIRVGNFIATIAPDLGWGDDPIGFMLASYATLAEERTLSRLTAPLPTNGPLPEEMIISEDDERLFRTNLLQCYGAKPRAFRVSKEHYRYLAEQLVATREALRRARAAPPAADIAGLIEQLDMIEIDDPQYSSVPENAATALRAQAQEIERQRTGHVQQYMGAMAQWESRIRELEALAESRNQRLEELRQSQAKLRDRIRELEVERDGKNALAYQYLGWVKEAHAERDAAIRALAQMEEQEETS